MTATDRSGRATVHPASEPANTPRPLATARRHERRRALIIICSTLLVATLGAAVAIAFGTFERAPELGNTSPTSEGRPQSARVIDEMSRRCQVFDNRTGRMSLAKACDEEARDKDGVPIPVGTIHRLDTISKSFSGH
jgi:hypothetical protein